MKKWTKINKIFLCAFLTWLPNDFATHLADGWIILITWNIIPCTYTWVFFTNSVHLDTIFFHNFSICIIWFTVVKSRKFYTSGLCTERLLKGLMSLHVWFENSLSAYFNFCSSLLRHVDRLYTIIHETKKTGTKVLPTATIGE